MDVKLYPLAVARAISNDFGGHFKKGQIDMKLIKMKNGFVNADKIESFVIIEHESCYDRHTARNASAMFSTSVRTKSMRGHAFTLSSNGSQTAKTGYLISCTYGRVMTND